MRSCQLSGSYILKVVAFWDLRRTNCLKHTALLLTVFARALAELCLVWYFVRNNGTNRFSFKRAFQWWFIRQIWLFWPRMWNSGFGGGSQAADHFLDPFLAWLICKKSSNQAEYMLNRESLTRAFQNATYWLHWTTRRQDTAHCHFIILNCLLVAGWLGLSGAALQNFRTWHF